MSLINTGPEAQETRRVVQAVTTCLWVFAFVAFALILRMHSITSEVINWDESTFIVMASSLLDGELPYDSRWDIKPPMIFFSLAGVMSVFGESLAAIRAFGAVCVGLAAAFCFLALRRDFGERAAGMAALVGVTLTASSVFLPTLTEHLAIVFLSAALWLIVRFEKTAPVLLGIGFFISLAALTRLNLGIAAVVLGLLIFYGSFGAKSELKIWSVGYYILGGLVPMFAFLAIYWARGMLQIFIDTNLIVPLVFATEKQPFVTTLHNLVFSIPSLVYRNPHTWGAAMLLCGAAIVILWERWRRRDQIEPGMGAVFSVQRLFLGSGFVTLLSMVASGHVSHHHLLQLFPVIVYLIAVALAFVEGMTARRIVWGLAILAVVGATIDFVPRTVAAASDFRENNLGLPIWRASELIRSDMKPGDLVYAVESHLIYWYLGIAPPVRLATHPSILLHPFVYVPMVALGYARPEPFFALLRDKPQYIVKHSDSAWYMKMNPQAENTLSALLESNYQLWNVIEHIQIFKRKPVTSPSQVFGMQEKGYQKNIL